MLPTLSDTRPLHLVGANLSAQAILLSSTQSPYLILCPNDKIAWDLTCNLKTLIDISSTSSEHKIFHFPGWDILPTQAIHFSSLVSKKRLEVFSYLAQKPILISTLPATFQATLPPSLFQNASFSLQKGMLPLRPHILEKLKHSGYTRVDLVEDRGTFAIRGEILDVFPSHEDDAFRIQWDDDHILRISRFDPSTQCTVENQDSLFIPPAHEVLLPETPELRAEMRKKIKKQSQERSISRSFLQSILDTLHAQYRPLPSELWAFYAYEKTSNLWDYLPEDYEVVWSDPEYCLRSFQEMEKKHDQIPQELMIPPFHEAYPGNTELQKIVSEKSTLFFHQRTPESSHERLHLQPHLNLKLQPPKNLALMHSQWIQEGYKILFFASTQSQLQKMAFFFGSHPSTSLHLGTMSEGFQWADQKLIVLTEKDIWATVKKNTSTPKNPLLFDALERGDWVIHRDHGIARYQGLTQLPLAAQEFLILEYAHQDKLYLPSYRMNVLQKYLGTENTTPHKLGTQQFEKTKEKVKASAKKLAFDLVKLYAQRKTQSGLAFPPCDSDFHTFEAKFPFHETEDQLKAIEDVLKDLQSGQVMDRLICGDVGFGKTEVAMRAAFRAVEAGKQVAVLVPTTILALQHELSFQKRFEGYPVLIESLSRLKSSKQQKKLLEALAQGKIDIVIGTHRMLSRDVQFSNLGLLIIDEEHRFGVEHKERLKTLKINTHALTLTATPIPRTLHMSLAGLREISFIRTPPVDRLPIRTSIVHYREDLVKQAIEFELARGGQVFYLHHQIIHLHRNAEKIEKLVPHAKIGIAHGKMDPQSLETIILDFYQKKTQLLLCTSLIESGIDIPSANTLLVDRADTFGLAQLYQIRGRVGRGEQRAYAYFFVPKNVSETAQQRLNVLERFASLGSGFHIASHDLELRGGGDLLGAEQSGNIHAVGYDLYTEILQEAISELEKTPSEIPFEPEIHLPHPAFLDEKYVPSTKQRIALYRSLSTCTQEAHFVDWENQLQDRFGVLPLEAQNLLWLMRIKLLLQKNNIATLKVSPEKIALTLRASDSHLRKPDKFLLPKATNSIKSIYFELETLYPIPHS